MLPLHPQRSPTGPQFVPQTQTIVAFGIVHCALRRAQYLSGLLAFGPGLLGPAGLPSWLWSYCCTCTESGRSTTWQSSCAILPLTTTTHRSPSSCRALCQVGEGHSAVLVRNCQSGRSPHDRLAQTLPASVEGFWGSQPHQAHLLYAAARLLDTLGCDHMSGTHAETLLGHAGLPESELWPLRRDPSDAEAEVTSLVLGVRLSVPEPRAL